MSVFEPPRSMAPAESLARFIEDPQPSYSWEQCQPSKKSRKVSCTRYVRTWTDEEEAFLDRSRRQKMPYKEISVRLRKTELACRLHYHQMTSYKRRRDQKISTKAPTSSHAVGSTSNRPADSLHKLTYANGSARSVTAAETKGSLASSRHFVSFPPRPSPPCPPTYPPYNNSQTAEVVSTRDSINLARLGHVYEEHRESIWTAIAQAYSARVDLSPFDLEAAFFTAQSSSPESLAWSSPPTLSTCPTTPNTTASRFGETSPMIGTGVAPVHSPRPNRCTVSALLNDYELSPRAEQRFACF